MSPKQLAVLLFGLASVAADDIGASLLAAMRDAGADGSVAFDLDALHRYYPDIKRRPLEQRVARSNLLVRSPDGATRGRPGSLLDLAFGLTEHTPKQKALQLWLFQRCARLPSSGSEGGLRRECTRKIAAFAAMLQGGEDGVDTAGLSKVRAEAVGTAPGAQSLQTLNGIRCLAHAHPHESILQS